MSLKVDLNKELEKKFRELAMKQFGYSKGSIKKAAHVAIETWTKKGAKEMKKEIDGRKFVEEFVSVPKKLKKVDMKEIKKILEEEYESQ